MASGWLSHATLSGSFRLIGRCEAFDPHGAVLELGDFSIRIEIIPREEIDGGFPKVERNKDRALAFAIRDQGS